MQLNELWAFLHFFFAFSYVGSLVVAEWNGRVVRVSADSIYDDSTKQAYFNIIIETDRAYLQSGRTQLPITPGMVCDAEIITGRKSILDYLLNPVLRARSEALRER